MNHLRTVVRYFMMCAEYHCALPLTTCCVMLCVGILWRALALAEYHCALPLTIYVVFV